jgi:hypothetical protein
MSPQNDGTELEYCGFASPRRIHITICENQRTETVLSLQPAAEGSSAIVDGKASIHVNNSGVRQNE